MPPLPPAKVLIRTLALIEDDDDDDFFLRRSLAKGNIATQVIRLRGGREAIDYFARKGPFADTSKYPNAQIAFIDLNMPGLNGFEVLRWLQQQPSDRARPFSVILSSSDLADDQSRAFNLGADCYITKPVSTESLHELAAAHSMEWLHVHGPRSTDQQPN